MKTLIQPINSLGLFKSTQPARRPGVRSANELLTEMRCESRWDARAWLLLALSAMAILILSF